MEYQKQKGSHHKIYFAMLFIVLVIAEICMTRVLNTSAMEPKAGVEAEVSLDELYADDFCQESAL